MRVREGQCDSVGIREEGEVFATPVRPIGGVNADDINHACRLAGFDGAKNAHRLVGNTWGVEGVDVRVHSTVNGNIWVGNKCYHVPTNKNP